MGELSRQILQMQSIMRAFSYNCKGLDHPTKRLGLKHMIAREIHEIIMLQETIHCGNSLITNIKSLFQDWDFIDLEALGQSRGLVTGWHRNSFLLLNSWGMSYTLGFSLFSREIGKCIQFINMYSPYTYQFAFRECFFNLNYLSQDILVIGGDLNITLSECDIWGEISHKDPLTSYFL